MKKHKYSDYENYILLCENSKGFKLNYSHFLNFVEVRKFLKHTVAKSAQMTPNARLPCIKEPIAKKTLKPVQNKLNNGLLNSFILSPIDAS